MKLIATGSHRGYKLSRSPKTIVKLIWTVSQNIFFEFCVSPLVPCVSLVENTNWGSSSKVVKSWEWGKGKGVKGKQLLGSWGNREGGKETVARLCGHGSRGGEKGSRWWEWQPGEKAGNHCPDVWKLRRKFFLQLVIIPFLGLLDQKCLVMVTLGHRVPDCQVYWSRNSSCGVHICCTEEMLILVSASWWKQKGSQVGRCRIWQRLQTYSVLGKMHSHFLKNFINKHYAMYYNDLNGISDRLLYLAITAWKQI